MEDTICAISTSLANGAISIIRCSGSEAINIVNKIFKGKDLTKVATHTINYGHIVYKNEIIDEVLVSVMHSPKTFTTEDTVEINTHGGIATTNRVLELLLLEGCRLAEPGEFTKRAFLNGRINLVEAEAVGDLITAETEKSRKAAVSNLTGSLTTIIETLRKDIIEIQANIEVNIDYPEYEEGEQYTKEKFLNLINKLKHKTDDLIKKSEDAKIIKNGINVALIGKPNVGKSSILNSLLEEDKAIVTNIPGTTRDIVEGQILLNGILLKITDTAGLRETTDEVEKIGVEKSIKTSNNSDLVIYVIDGSKSVSEEDIEAINKLNRKELILFVNKNDLETNVKLNSINCNNVIYGNTKEKEGLDNLKNKIVELFNLEKIDNSDYTYLSNSRQIALIKKVSTIIDNILNSIDSLPIDVFTIDLKNAYDILGEIIGKTYNDDLLDELFSRFCLGK